MEFRAGLVPVFENTWNTIFRPIWFLFLKTVVWSQKQGKYGEEVWFPDFYYSEKAEKHNTKSREQKQFSKNNKMVFSVFSKTVLNNSFQKQKPNWPFVLVFSVFFHKKKKKN